MRTSGVAWCVTVVAAASLGLVACSSSANSGSAGGGSTAGKKYTIGVSFDLLNAIRQAEKSSIQSAAKAAPVEFAQHALPKPASGWQNWPIRYGVRLVCRGRCERGSVQVGPEHAIHHRRDAV